MAGTPFTQLYRREYAFVVHSVRRLGVPPTEAEDLAQEVFLVCLRRGGELDERGSPRSWLWAVARRVCSNHRRRTCRKGQQLHPSSRWEQLGDRDCRAPDESAAQSEVLRQCKEALARLDPKKRVTFILAELEGLTAREIAPIVGASPDTVASRLRAARCELRSVQGTLASTRS
jgi:RNA polymerase sigma-70 factor (ECF subfamily)